MKEWIAKDLRDLENTKEDAKAMQPTTLPGFITKSDELKKSLEDLKDDMDMVLQMYKDIDERGSRGTREGDDKIWNARL